MNYRLLIVMSFILLVLSLASASASDVNQSALHDASLDNHIDYSLHDTAIADGLVSDLYSDDSLVIDKYVPDSSDSSFIDDGTSSADAVDLDDDGSADMDGKDVPVDDGSADMDGKGIPVDDGSSDKKLIPSHDDSNLPIDTDIADDDSIIRNMTNDIPKNNYNDKPISNVKEATGSFDDLQSLIDLVPSGTVLLLYSDYKGAADKQVTIDKDLTLDGQGHTIDCAGICRAIYSSSGNVLLRNLKFANGHYDTSIADDKTNNGGAIWIGGTAKYTIENCNFTNNWADDMGGAIYNDAINNLTIINCVFKSSTADDVSGGAIFSNGSIHVYDSLFDGNAAKECGGAIYCAKTSHVHNCIFRNNKVDGVIISNANGAAICSKKDLYIDHSSFVSNWADDYGGAVYTYGNLYINYRQDGHEIFNTFFDSNTADDDEGGAIYCEGNAFINNAAFSSNKAYTDGGAIFTKGFAYINHCLFEYNKCSGAFSQCKGGAIYGKGDINVENSTFKSNSAEDYGGAIYAYNVNINQYSSLGKSHFINNKALDDDGGAIYSSDHCNVNNAEFDSNTADANGGAIYSYKTNIENSTFKKNYADDNGGAIWFGNLLDAYNSEFISNKALIDGGAIFGSTFYVNKCLFDSNRAEGSKLHKCYGGAIRANEISVLRTKFIKNYSENHGGAIFAERASDIKECIFDGNSAKDDGGAVYVNLGELFIIRLSECLCINNKAGDEGGVLYADSVDARVKLLHNVFANNSAKDGQVAFNKGTYSEICNNWWCGANPTKNDNVLVEWKFWTSNVNHVDSDPLEMVLQFDKNFVKVGQIVRATIYFVKSNGDLFKEYIPTDFSFSLPNSIKEVSSGFDQNSAYIDLIAEKSGMFFILGNSFDYPGAANILFVLGSDLSKDISNTNSGIVKNANSLNSQFDDGCLIDKSIFNPAKTMDIPKSNGYFSIYSMLLSILDIFGL